MFRVFKKTNHMLNRIYKDGCICGYQLGKMKSEQTAQRNIYINIFKYYCKSLLTMIPLYRWYPYDTMCEST